MAGRIGPRRSLPNRRAVLGALLVTAATTGSFLVATHGDTEPDTSYLVLRSAVAVGEPIASADVGVEALDLGDTVARSALAPSAPVDGSIALRDLRAGELLSVDDLLATPTIAGARIGAVHELTIPAPNDWSPGSLFPGDRVTILATVRDGATDATSVAAEDVTVIAFDRGDDTFRPTARLTLAIDEPRVVVSLAHLAQQGALTIVRTTRAIDDHYPQTAPPTSAPPSESRP